MYECRIERDTLSAHTNHRLTTFVITFPRIVLAETVTHRVNLDMWGGDTTICERTTTANESKNSASSRAIPHERFIQRIKDDPYMPDWTSAAKGMQGGSDLNPRQIEEINKQWLWARDAMLGFAERVNGLGVHKQDTNRLLEPWAWVTQIVTSSQWDNFFALRCHHMAHPAFRKIARMMFLKRWKSTPQVREYGQWHMPFADLEGADFRWEPHKKWVKSWRDIPYPLLESAARCAWVSYENHEKDASQEAVERTCARLMDSAPVHASPFEHQGTPGLQTWVNETTGVTHNEHHDRAYKSNLEGYIQLRKLIPMEQVKVYDPGLAELETWPEYQLYKEGKL